MIEILSLIAMIVLIDKNARAYGFECGRDGVVMGSMHTSPDNPFVHDNWREFYGLEW